MWLVTITADAQLRIAPLMALANGLPLTVLSTPLLGVTTAQILFATLTLDVRENRSLPTFVMMETTVPLMYVILHLDADTPLLFVTTVSLALTTFVTRSTDATSFLKFATPPTLLARLPDAT